MVLIEPACNILIFFSRTRETAFSGNNGQNFADLVCQKLGFKKSNFIGNNKEYNDFLRREQMRNEKIIANNGTSIPCFPEYFIAGGTCEKKTKTLDDVSERSQGQTKLLKFSTFFV